MPESLEGGKKKSVRKTASVLKKAPLKRKTVKRVAVKKVAHRKVALAKPSPQVNAAVHRLLVATRSLQHAVKKDHTVMHKKVASSHRSAPKKSVRKVTHRKTASAHKVTHKKHAAIARKPATKRKKRTTKKL